MGTFDIVAVCQQYASQKVRNLLFTIVCRADTGGVWITTRKEIASLCGMSEWDVRLGLKFLVDSHAILKQNTNKSTIVTLCSLGDCITMKETHSPTKLQQNSNKKEKDTSIHEAAERIYDKYPTKCIVSGRSTGKSRKKDIATIIRLLNGKEYTEEKLLRTIDQYLDESKKTGTYIKNFSTFLNNIPDYDDMLDISLPSSSPTSTIEWQ